MTAQTQGTMAEINRPGLWLAAFPWPRQEMNKYARGGLAVAGGGIESTGAARMVAQAAARIGAGAVTVACDRESLPVYAAHFTSVMTRVCEDAEAFAALIEDRKVSAVALGPGLGRGEETKVKVLAALKTNKPVLLDADGLTSFAGKPQALFDRIAGPVVMTPHEGEFSTLFEDVPPDSKATPEMRALIAAKSARAIIVLKGHVTVIATPEGRLMADMNGVPDLATAGSGDVLSGMIGGLLAQNMPAFEAALAGVWLHGEAAKAFGPGLMAEDLPDVLPPLLRKLKG